jgi:phosphoesterase RecJ-like protein
MWTAIKALIREHQRFVLSTHVNPDGDAIGSELALASLLRALGKDVMIINSDPTPRHYRFLDPDGDIRVFDPQRDLPFIKQVEVILAVDASGGWDRLGSVGSALAAVQAKVGCIDHHPDPNDFADVAVICDEAAATAELIYDLILDMGEDITLSIAKVLYAGIMTDTGSFHFPKTRPQTHRIAASLLERGVIPDEVHSQVYEQYPAGRLWLQGETLSHLKLECNGRLAWYTLEHGRLEAYNLTVDDLEGFPTMGLTIQGVEVSIFFAETTKGVTKVSLRSRGGVSLTEVAHRFGGGGHASAAGATIDRPLHQAVPEVLAAVIPLLEK